MIGSSLKTIKFIKHFKDYQSAENEIVRKRALLYLKELLKTEGGILTKFLQYKGTSPEELTEINDLSQKSLGGINFSEIKQILERSLGDKFRDISDISEDAVAASVGQVHFAKLKGEEVALKIQYPNIKNTFIEQLKIFKILPAALKVSPLRKWGIDIASYQVKLQQLIEQECDYTKEAAQLIEWKKYLAEVDHCSVPEVYLEYSRENILALSKVDGETIDNLKDEWQPAEKQAVGEHLIYSYFFLLLKHGVTQGDTNHGNFLFQREIQEVVYIDLGQTVQFSERFLEAIHYLVDTKLNNKQFCAYSFLIEIGFEAKKLNSLVDRLDVIVDILFEPLFADYAFDINEWKYKRDLDLLLGEDKWWFRSAGGTEFFLFMKSFMGIKNLLAKLGQKIYYRGIIFDVMKKVNFPGTKIALTPLPEGNTGEKSQKIQILVIEDDREKVKMQLPFAAIFELEQYLSEEIHNKVKAQGINISDVIQDALRDGGKPKEVFGLELGTKKIEIALK